MSDLDCRNELVARERRGELSPAERVALDAHLAQCASCRLSRLLGSDFEAEATLEADDGVRIAALSAVAERWAAGQVGSVAPVPLKRRRARVALLAVAAALAAVGASAAGGTWSKVFGGDEPAKAPAAPANVAPTQPAKPAPKSVSEKTEPSAPSPEASEPKARTQAAAVESAASLLGQASAARRAGDADRAVALYRRLVNEFPSSPEAGLAALPLGGLLLDRGEARSALAQFDRHVRGSRSSRLLPEALYGRGRSLAALGNRTEERRNWNTLLEQYPESPYAGHAKRRLSELKPAD